MRGLPNGADDILNDDQYRWWKWMLDQWWANFFCERPDNKYFWSLSHACNPVFAGKQLQLRWKHLCFSKTLFTKRRGSLDLTHRLQIVYSCSRCLLFISKILHWAGETHSPQGLLGKYVRFERGFLFCFVLFTSPVLEKNWGPWLAQSEEPVTHSISRSGVRAPHWV